MLLLRGIDNKRFWDRGLADRNWLPNGEYVADVYKGCKTSDGKLSVYAVDGSPGQIGRVVAALAGAKHHLSNYDYFLFDDSILSPIGVMLDTEPGTTIDEGIKGWHRNIVNLSTLRLANLVNQLGANYVAKRALPGEVATWIDKSLSSGYIPVDRLGPNVREDLNKHRPFQESAR